MFLITCPEDSKLMKYLKVCISSLILLLMSASLASAIELSLNQSRFIPGKTLALTLNEDWSDEADVYVAVTLPGDDTFFFLTPPLNFGLDFVPYAVAARASGSSEILRIDLPAGLPTGEYTFHAAAMRVTGFIDEIIGNVVQASFIFATEAEPVDLTFGDSRLPDGVIERTYSFAIEPETGMPPYQFSLISGTLPDGLTLGSESGLIQGEPTVRGMAQFTVQVVDASGNVGEIERAIKVFGVLSFGEHGTYKGCNGLQMAFNSAQDLDEIRIEQGTYECNGLLIPKSKTFEHGIKVSGGWDSGFVSQSDAPAVTVFDGGAKRIEGIENDDQCEDAGGVWKSRVCFQKEPPSSSILSVSANGSVAIEGLFFQNGYRSGDGGAIHGNREVDITNCVFTDNNNTGYDSHGGAVYRVGNITNSTFTNNSASSGGGAISSSGNITNSTFTNNSASSGGGAISSSGNITNSTFTNNTASFGGAVSGADNITNSTFTNNSASSGGGAISSSGNITNCTFTDNSASENGGAVSNANTITNSTFTNNRASENGGAIFYSSYSSSITITNSTFFNNSASKNGGAINGSSTIINNCTIVNNGGGFYGRGSILNTIFAQNKVGEEANDITPNGDLHVDYTLVNYISGAVDLGTHIIMGEPRFVDADNGNFRLRADSPAIDVGYSSVVTACSRYDNCESSCSNNCDDRNSEECKKTCCQCTRYSHLFLRDDNGNALDLDGNSRLVGGAIDLGAYEVQ